MESVFVLFYFVLLLIIFIVLAVLTLNTKMSFTRINKRSGGGGFWCFRTIVVALIGFALVARVDNNSVYLFFL